MKKILFVTTRDIFPTNDGRKVVLYNYCKGLAEQLNYEVSLFIIENIDERNEEKPNFISNVYYADKPKIIEKIKNLSINTFLLNKWPLQVSVYYSRKTQMYLNTIIENYNPDTVICDMARTAEYLKNLDNCKYNKILDMDDLLSKRYKRQLDSKIFSENSIGAYVNNLPKILKKLTRVKLINKLVLYKEAKLLKKYEISISNYYKSIVFVSRIEANEFNNIIGEKKSKDITIGINYDYFSQKVVDKIGKHLIVFLGNMNVAHNKESVKYFLDNIYPHVLKKIPDCIFRIVGKCDDSYKLEMRNYKNVQITGEVDDIRKYIQDCNIGVAILKYGTGIKTKILELMAMGIPIVTNEIGNEGIGLVNNRNAILENDKENIINRIIYLLDNEDIQRKIGDEGQKFVKENYQWNNIIPKFNEIL